MNLRPSHISLLAGAVVLIVAVWLLMRQGDTPPTPAAGNPAVSSKSTKKLAGPLATNPDDTAPPPSSAGPGQPHITLAQISPWLERSGRSPEALVAAWELTQDPALEAEMAEKHAGNPLVCLMLLQNPDGTINQAWVDRLRLADPNHPLPDCLAVAQAAQAGDIGAAKAALAQALTKKDPLNLREKERIAAIREATAAMSVSPAEAAMAPSTVFKRNQATQNIIQGAMALAKQAKTIAASGDASGAEEAAGAAITLTAFLGTNANETLMQRLGKGAVIARASEILPPETELGNSGRTIAQALQEDEKNKEITRQFISLSLETAPPADSNAFWDQWLIGGEIGAMQWAIKRFGGRETGK